MTGASVSGETNFKWNEANAPFKNEILNYYKINELNCSLRREQSLTPKQIEELINIVEIAYQSLNKTNYKKITSENWFSKLQNLLIAADEVKKEAKYEANSKSISS